MGSIEEKIEKVQNAEREYQEALKELQEGIKEKKLIELLRKLAWDLFKIETHIKFNCSIYVSTEELKGVFEFGGLLPSTNDYDKLKHFDTLFKKGAHEITGFPEEKITGVFKCEYPA